MTSVLSDDEWKFLRRLIDEFCPFHKDGPFVKGTEGTSMTGQKNPCYHLTLGRIQGLEIAMARLRE